MPDSSLYNFHNSTFTSYVCSKNILSTLFSDTLDLQSSLGVREWMSKTRSPFDFILLLVQNISVRNSEGDCQDCKSRLYSPPCLNNPHETLWHVKGRLKRGLSLCQLSCLKIGVLRRDLITSMWSALSNSVTHSRGCINRTFQRTAAQRELLWNPFRRFLNIIRLIFVTDARLVFL